MHEQAFQSIKDLITRAPVLCYYSFKEQLVLQCDASDTGLGAALLQSGEPVAFGSRALSLTEWGYAQIEKRVPSHSVQHAEIPSIHLWTESDHTIGPQAS